MPTITLSSKHQVTLPADLVRSLGLKPGDKLVAELINGRIILLPQPESWTDYFQGSMKGVYGSTVEEIDEYIREVRGYHLYDEWQQEFEDMIAADDDARKIVEHLRGCRHHRSPHSDFGKIEGINSKRVQEALDKLIEHGGVRKIPAPPAIGAGIESSEWVYMLVRDFAKR